LLRKLIESKCGHSSDRRSLLRSAIAAMVLIPRAARAEQAQPAGSVEKVKGEAFVDAQAARRDHNPAQAAALLEQLAAESKDPVPQMMAERLRDAHGAGANAVPGRPPSRMRAKAHRFGVRLETNARRPSWASAVTATLQNTSTASPMPVR
jgi:hypothetical protein